MGLLVQTQVCKAYSRKAYTWFFRKKAKKQKYIQKGQKGQKSEKLGKKCTKFENILKKGRWWYVIIAHYKLLE